MSLGRKRKLTVGEEENLKECLAVPYSSEQAILRVWHIARKLQPEVADTSVSVLKTVAAKRLRGAKACFVKWRVPSTKEDVWMPPVVDILQFMLDDAPAWRSAFKGAHAACRGELQPILYHDDVTCGNILTVIKNKKVTAAYLSFRELFPHVVTSCCLGSSMSAITYRAESTARKKTGRIVSLSGRTGQTTAPQHGQRVPTTSL